MKPHTWNMILDAESARDFFAVSSLRQFNHLIQFDDKPNFEIKEPRWEIYKISLTFPSTGENQVLFHLLLLVLDVVNHVALLKGTDHRVLFQNAEGTINMGVCFDDPDLEMSDIFWYNQLSKKMHVSLLTNDGLTSSDAESGTVSCYVELHRIDIHF